MVDPKTIEYLTHLCEDFRKHGDCFEFTTNDVCVLEGLIRSLNEHDTYAEPEYTAEQLNSDPIAIDGARFDDMNYLHRRER